MNAKLKKLLLDTPYTVLYFYPKDNTPGCTMEAQDFSRLKTEFLDLGVQIIGVSKDDEASHKHFIESCGLNITLLSDTSGTLSDQFGVIGEKKNYGITYIGVIRSTFLLDQSGTILHEWRNVRARGHADRILKEVPTLLEAHQNTP